MKGYILWYNLSTKFVSCLSDFDQAEHMMTLAMASQSQHVIGYPTPWINTSDITNEWLLAQDLGLVT